MSQTGYGVDIILVEGDMVGGISTVKSKLQSIIASASSSLIPASQHVMFNWKTPMNQLSENFPVVTIKLGAAQYTDTIYGRKVSSTEYGQYVVFPFTLHVWNEKLTYETQDENESGPTTDIAELIVDKLDRFGGDSNLSGICYFYDLTARESQPERGPQNLNRVIIVGFMLVKRLIGDD